MLSGRINAQTTAVNVDAVPAQPLLHVCWSHGAGSLSSASTSRFSFSPKRASSIFPDPVCGSKDGLVQPVKSSEANNACDFGL